MREQRKKRARVRMRDGEKKGVEQKSVVKGINPYF